MYVLMLHVHPHARYMHVQCIHMYMYDILQSYKYWKLVRKNKHVRTYLRQPRVVLGSIG